MTSPTALSAMLAALEPVLAAALEPDTVLPDAPDAHMDLRSIEVVTLVDLLEAEFDVVFGSDDVRPEHFATRRAIAERLLALGAPCG